MFSVELVARAHETGTVPTYDGAIRRTAITVKADNSVLSPVWRPGTPSRVPPDRRRRSGLWVSASWAASVACQTS